MLRAGVDGGCTMKARTPFTYGTEGRSGWNHDQMAELMRSFDLFYDPSFDDCDLREIQEAAHKTESLQSC